MLAVHIESGSVTVREVARPERRSGFALIQVIYAGICNTDLELQRGYYGFAGIPGHEFVGEVVEADTTTMIGKRVVGEINLGCRGEDCEWCNCGRVRHCPRRTVLGIVKHPGAFAEMLTLPEANLHVVPDSISDKQAVFVEPLAAARRILDQFDIRTNEPIAVLGRGKLGSLIERVLHAHGAQVDSYGRNDYKRPQAYDYVIDATGSPDGLEQALRMTRPLGNLILKSTLHGLVPIDAAAVAVHELNLVGSRCGRFEPALEMLKAGQVRVDDLISDVLPLGEAPRAFQRATEPGVLKVLLRM